MGSLSRKLHLHTNFILNGLGSPFMMLRLRTLGMEASAKKIGNGHPSYVLREHYKKVFRGHFLIKYPPCCHCTLSDYILIITRLKRAIQRTLGNIREGTWERE